MRANWFIAMPVDPGAWFELVPPAPSGIRKFAPSDLHLTIAFLGGVAEAAARAGWEAIVWNDGPRTVTLADVVPMGSPRRYSALSLLLDEGREQVELEMTRARGAAYAAAGTPPDERPAKAHITIARPKRHATDDERAAALEWARACALHATPIRLEKLALYTWSDDRTSELFRIVEQRACPVHLR
jgi:2'-5' RNA ligase